ncbi:uncharacterized protein LOC112051179 [Bicyclus anynana]|uniref:Uncharacterized protein LOC112051179 n=1 Tax=Bicyclus anynana TaxID=110368 RepID=A0A6J1NKQ3_BICAN|nr:uncharacterized protein LOC112051179 [Bicyclus anynana]XP_052746738.1 uncharacterized protein LOC112051179 [Bicyclus anynana]
MIRTLFVLISVVKVFTLPVDDPIRIDLPVYDPPQSDTTGTLAQSTPQENSEHESNERPVTIVLGSKVNSNSLIGSVNYGSGLFSPTVTKLDGALLETEGIASKALSVKENVQNAVAGIFQPQPIVDTIKEEEKYGNSGDKFRDTGRAIVNGAEGISNFVNSILEVPSRIFRSITRAASEKLNNLGSKLVGL